MGRTCGAYGEERGVHRVLVGKPEGKRPLERPSRRWEDNFGFHKMRGISWLAAKTCQFIKKDSAPWNKQVVPEIIQPVAARRFQC
jgi:hypothetical protein